MTSTLRPARRPSGICGLTLVALLDAFAPVVASSDDGATRAGALLAGGRVDEAASITQHCASTSCHMVLARALFAVGRLREAAQALDIDAGELRAHALTLRGESLLLGGSARDAVIPLREAAAFDGAPAPRASALLADALLEAGNFSEARSQALRAHDLPGQPPDVRAGLAWDAAQALARLEPSAAASEFHDFWLAHPEHPAAESARALETMITKALPEPSGHEALVRASRLLAAGEPKKAAQESFRALSLLHAQDTAEAALIHARALAADDKRGDATPFLEQAWAHGHGHVAAQAGMLLARDRARRGRESEAIDLADVVARKYPGSREAAESVLFTARLMIDAGKGSVARARLARLASSGRSSSASEARWMLAWTARKDGQRDARQRLDDFVANAATATERAQGLYWRSYDPENLRRVIELDPLGWYGTLARARLGSTTAVPPPFPPLRSPEIVPPALSAAMQLISLGWLSDAAAEADWFVRRHPGDAAAEALVVYELAGRFDRSVVLAESLLASQHVSPPRRLLVASYPIAFAPQVAQAASRRGIDPYLLLSVIRRESLFRADTRSPAGAVGLLQLLPATARRISVELGGPRLNDEDLFDPAAVIDLGAWYLSELLERFGDPVIALAAYNAGPNVALPWIAAGSGRPLDEWVEDIPYRETRRYVKAVVGAWSAYRILAGGSPPTLSSTIPIPRRRGTF